MRVIQSTMIWLRDPQLQTKCASFSPQWSGYVTRSCRRHARHSVHNDLATWPAAADDMRVIQSTMIWLRDPQLQTTCASFNPQWSGYVTRSCRRNARHSIHNDLATWPAAALHVTTTYTGLIAIYEGPPTRGELAPELSQTLTQYTSLIVLTSTPNLLVDGRIISIICIQRCNDRWRWYHF